MAMAYSLTIFLVVFSAFISIRIVDPNECDIHLFRDGMDNSRSKSARSIKGFEPKVEAICVLNCTNPFVFKA
jgi:hypothetical protein